MLRSVLFSLVLLAAWINGARAELTIRFHCEHEAGLMEAATALREADSAGNKALATRLSQAVKGLSSDGSLGGWGDPELFFRYSSGCNVDFGWQGEITSDAGKGLEEFVDAVEAHQRDQGHLLNPIIRLNSNGGSVLGALEMGRVIRKHQLRTSVEDGDPCLSACVFVYAGGVSRAPYGPIGVHRPRFEERYFAGLSFDQASAKYEQMLGTVRQYLSDLRINPDFIRLMMSVPSENIHILTEQELKSFGLIGDDPVYAEWRIAKMKARLGPKGLARLRWVDQEIVALRRSCRARFPATRADPLAESNCLAATPFVALCEERERLCQPDDLGDCTHFLLGYGKGALAPYSE